MNFDEQTALTAEYAEAFYFFDRDGNKKIEADELGAVMRSLGHNPSEEDLKKMMDEVDTDRSGAIEFKEFMALMAPRHMNTNDSTDELKEAFKVFDKDGQGTISVDDLRHVMTNLGDEFSDEEVHQLISEADNGDGVINYGNAHNELVAMRVSHDQKIKVAFDIFDNDGKGVVPKEIGNVMRYLRAYPTEEELESKILPQIRDEEGSTIRFEVFQPFMRKVLEDRQYEPDTEETVLQAFRTLDPEGKGFMKEEKLRELLTSAEGGFTDNEADVFLSFGRGDQAAGQIFYEEYVDKLFMI